MTRFRATRSAAVCAVLASSSLLAACTSSGAPGATSTSSRPVRTSSPAPTHASSSRPAPSPKPKPHPKPAPKPRPAAKNPFTGIGPVPKLPTVIAKIDDTGPGRPQVGIDRADVVYIEEAEGGLSRLAAVFGTNKPVVGYVRSTRPSDPLLFLQYGKAIEAASGGGGDSLPRLDRSGLRAWINDRSAPYYFRVDRPESTYINLELPLRKVAEAVQRRTRHAKHPAPRPHDIGFRFSAKPPVKGIDGTDLHTVVGATEVEFKWWAKLHRYVRFIDGQAQHAADGKLITAANVVVQVCRITVHPQDRDVLGNPSQFTHSVGRGKVAVFRNGRMIRGYWHRAHAKDGTRFAFKSGAPITLSPGNTWVALVRPSARTTGS